MGPGFSFESRVSEADNKPRRLSDGGISIGLWFRVACGSEVKFGLEPEISGQVE